MRIVEHNKNPAADHEHYVLKSDGQTVGAVYDELTVESPFGTFSNLDVSVHRASTMASLIAVHMDGFPIIGGFPPDISRLYVDHIIGTRDKNDDGKYYHHIMIYV